MLTVKTNESETLAKLGALRELDGKRKEDWEHHFPARQKSI